MKKYNVAVVGVTGAVGEEMLRVLEEVDFPINKLVPLASSRSAGSMVDYKNKEHKVLELTETVFEEQDVEIALFSAGGSISAKFAPFAAEAGAIVIDNTSHFRMDDDIPLVVPEVNPNDIALWKNRGIIANPNCSTIQMVQALKPIDELYNIQRVDVSTYQATSGAGKSAMEELVLQMKDFFAFNLENSKINKFPHQIALNLIPQIDKFTENGYTKEELKMVNETRKIMHKDIKVSATCVRVPVLRGHSESVTITCEKDVDVDVIREAIKNGENLVLLDEVEKSIYPMPLLCTDKNETFVGRVRRDLHSPNIIHLFVVADNLRVGAATNAVRIAQKWIEMEG
ncbi:MAG: aspartate-semialdehyde dehydrogenase [Campylobacterales bacterium]|nr:aspartate-semialdehyde dehydrogenase [Campylobacterales bacterium]